jgi:hypothetical protein
MAFGAVAGKVLLRHAITAAAYSITANLSGAEEQMCAYFTSTTHILASHDLRRLSRRNNQL